MTSEMQTYTYSILRFIPDIRTGEFLNVGVALHSRENNVALIKCRDTFARIKSLNNKVDGYGLLRILKSIKSEYNTLALSSANELKLEPINSVFSICSAVLPKDDSSLQWSEVRSGKCKNLNSELSRMYERFVSYADEESTTRKTENDIWREFSKEIAKHRFSQPLKPHTITTTDDKVGFEHAFKNGIWHCVQPLSFDLMHSQNMRDKAHKWIGQLASVSKSDEKFKVYFLIGKPSDSNLVDSYENAKSILKNIPQGHEVYTESESRRLLDELEAVVH